MGKRGVWNHLAARGEPARSSILDFQNPLTYDLYNLYIQYIFSEVTHGSSAGQQGS